MSNENVDSGNRAHSIMGPECSFCGHRSRWHDPDGCKRTPDCRCGVFDDGIGPGSFGILWHTMRGHDPEDRSTVVTDAQGLQRLKYRTRCSCGKEWPDMPCKICGKPSMRNSFNLAVCLDHAEQLIKSHEERESKRR